MNTQHISLPSDFSTTDLNLKEFKVYEVECGVNAVPSYNRRDFYKICLNTGKYTIHYADRSIETEGPILFFGNSHIPYAWEIVSPLFNGCVCVFTEDFLTTHERVHQKP